MKRTLKILLLAACTLLGGASHAADAKDKVKKKDDGIDWQKLLGDLRERFAGSSDTALTQTRIDRAYFELNADDPDLPPFLVFKGVCLRTAHDDEKQMKDFLRKELAKFPAPNTKFVVKIDDIAFHEAPIYKLQDAAVAAFKADATFNNFFERAAYAADGSLRLNVLCLRYDESTNAKLDKLLKDNPVANELIQLPDGKPKPPTLIRRDYDWLGNRNAQQGKFASDDDPLLQRTRLNDGYLHYPKDDRKKIHFNVSGVCIHPPGLVAQAEREKRWKARVSNLFPKLVYEPTVADIAMLPNPSIAWQNDLAADQRHDGVFIQLARFDGAGELTWIVKSPSELYRPVIRKLIEENPVAKQLAPVAAKAPDFQLWSWNDVIPTGQARLAEGDFLLHRARLDRAFLKYDDPKLDDPHLHIEGVSLNPTTIVPDANQRIELEKTLKDLLPSAMAHKWNSERIRFLDSPIYALQTEVNARNLEGMLFADGRFDKDGKLHLAVALAIEGQRETAIDILKATPIGEGIIGPRDDKNSPLLDFTVLAWDDILNQMQRSLARDDDSLFRKTRVDHGTFSYPANKVGPNLNLTGVGIYPVNDVYTARLKKRFKLFADLYLKDQLRAGPIAAVPMMRHVDNPAPIMQGKVAELEAHDGIRLDDASFHADGKLVFHGLWIDGDQRRALEKLVEDTITIDAPVLRRGFHWGAMQEFNSPALLLELRTWIAGQEDIDEVWLERFHFDGLGKVRVPGFATRKEDKEKVVRKLPDFLPKFESKKLPAIEPPTPAKEPEKKDKDKEAEKKDKDLVPVIFLQDEKAPGPIQIDELFDKNITKYLRESIPKVNQCDGLRVDRCYYDPSGTFRIDGLADHEGHAADELKQFLNAAKVPFDRQRQLPNGWSEGRQTVIPLRPMMVTLHENLPSLYEFDGLTLLRPYHDAKNQLVFSATWFTAADAKEQAEIQKEQMERLKKLLDTHPRWRLRTTAGVVIDVDAKNRKKPNLDEANKNVMRALHLLQVNIGEAYVDEFWPAAAGYASFASHAWPFEPKLPRVRPTNDDYDRCLQYLDAAILHNPKNVLAWYLRGYVLQTKSRSDLSLRDYRRMVDLEMDDADLRHNRIRDLELVQGSLRQSAYRIEQEAILQVSEGWSLEALRERK